MPSSFQKKKQLSQCIDFFEKSEFHADHHCHFEFRKKELQVRSNFLIATFDRNFLYNLNDINTWSSKLKTYYGGVSTSIKID